MGRLIDILERLSTFTVQPIIKQALSCKCLKQQLASLDYPPECDLIKEWRMSTCHGSCCHIHYEVQIEGAIGQAGVCIIRVEGLFYRMHLPILQPVLLHVGVWSL